MAKLTIVLLSVVAFTLVVAQPPQSPEARTVREKSSNDGNGNFQFTYELDNGQIFSEAGALKDDGVTQFVSGAYSFVGPDGQTYWVTFTADENGFHPVIGKFCCGKDFRLQNLKFFTSD